MKLEIIEHILKHSVRAPSAENIQPWSFRVSNDELYVLDNSSEDDSFDHNDQNLNYIALGALIENIFISSTKYGYVSKVTYFPESQNTNVVAKIDFIKKDVEEDPLFSSIEKRCSNRRPYYDKALKPELLKELKTSDESLDRCDIKLINPDKENKLKLAKAISSHQKVLLENKLLHNFLFKHITWTKKEDQDKKAFFVDTLELSSPKKFVFRIVSTWDRLLTLRRFLPISDIVAKGNAKIYAKSELFIGFCLKDLEPASFLEIGRCLQRSLLINTRHGAASQILGGITLLALSHHDISEEHRNLINKSYGLIKEVFNTEKEIVIIARVGYAKKASARTLRHDPIIKFVS